ncbi:MAG: HDOD domain-containing protein [bacterium]
MEKISIVDQIRANDKLLSLPQVLSEILKEVSKENFSADKLAKIILRDPSLTAQILKMANSPFYHRMSEIKTVHQAVSIMGVTTVKCLALSTSVLNPERIARASGIDPKTFFSHVLSTAAAAESIASAVEFKPIEEAFIAGLLQDVGVLFFLHHFPRDYARIISRQVKARDLIQAEEKVFGVNHAEVGYHLADMWNLPSYMSKAIGTHHSATQPNETGPLSDIVALAAALTGDRFSGYEMHLEHRLRTIGVISKRLGLSKSQVDEISSSLLSRTVGVAEYLGIDIGNIEEMLVRANQEIWKSYLTMENLFKERQELTASLLREERAKGAAEAKTIAMATLSHYLNNATMAIYGRSQLIRMMLNKGQVDRVVEKLPEDLEIVDQSIAKIVAVLEEMRDISPIDEDQFHNLSRGLNIDDRLQKRLDNMYEEGAWAISVETAPVGK